MVCAGLDPEIYTGISGFLAYPTSCVPQFYAYIMGAIFIILSFILYNREKEDNRVLKPDFLSSMGVSAIAVIFISLIGTLLGIITSEIFIEILVLGIIFIAIWIFKD